MPDLTPTPKGGEDDAELTELRAFAARVAPGTVEWKAPPPELWGRITAAAAGPKIGTADIDDQPTTEATAEAPTEQATVVPFERSAGATARRTKSAGRHRSRTPWLVAALAPLGDAGEGSAELVETDGSLQLRLSTNDLDAGDGFLEVWVINPDVTQLVSLGPLRNDGVYVLPPGLDPTAFPIVDVSVEPIDGNPTHSGASVLRGELTF